jgi:hypothetical protein
MNRLEKVEAGYPFWVVGYVDAYGSVHARAISEHQTIYGSSMHTQEERLAGRPFRWNVLDQEFGEVLTGSAQLDTEDWYRVIDWLDERNWIDEEVKVYIHRLIANREKLKEKESNSL